METKEVQREEIDERNNGKREMLVTKRVQEEEIQKFQKMGFKIYKAMLRLGPKEMLMHKSYLQYADEHYNFGFRSDDVMVLSFPKSGTTWTSELDFVNPVDPMEDATLEMKKFRQRFPGDLPEDGVKLKVASSEPGPRHIQSNFMLSCFNPDLLNRCKVIYVARNPMDVCLSFYHFLSNMANGSQRVFMGEFEDFVEGFMGDCVAFGPYWPHVKEAWQLRHHPNLHFMFYEDLKTDIMGELRKLNNFLSVDLSDDQLEKIIEATSFSNMKAREESKPVMKTLQMSFFRQGKTGGFKSFASPQVQARMDAWVLITSLLTT
ncbi:Sulfotransferase 1C4-like 6, partial [Homarus americanus]